MNLGKIREVCAKRKIPVSHIAKQIGLSSTGLYLAIDRNTLQAKHLEAISKILDVPIWEFFDIDPSTEIGLLKSDLEMSRGMNGYLDHKIKEHEKDSVMLMNIHKMQGEKIEQQTEIIEQQKKLIEKLTKG